MYQLQSSVKYNTKKFDELAGTVLRSRCVFHELSIKKFTWKLWSSLFGSELQYEEEKFPYYNICTQQVHQKFFNLYCILLSLEYWSYTSHLFTTLRVEWLVVDALHEVSGPVKIIHSNCVCDNGDTTTLTLYTPSLITLSTLSHTHIPTWRGWCNCTLHIVSVDRGTWETEQKREHTVVDSGVWITVLKRKREKTSCQVP